MLEAGSIVWAKVGAYPWWPSRVCYASEAKPYEQHRSNFNQKCVVFFGENPTHGWVFPKALADFETCKEEKQRQAKGMKKSNLKDFKKSIQQAVEYIRTGQKEELAVYMKSIEKENGTILAKEAAAAAKSKNKNKNKKRARKRGGTHKKTDDSTPVGGCRVCSEDTDPTHILICDSESCGAEYHMSCLTPKLKKAPKGDWFCPVCVAGEERCCPICRNSTSSSGTIKCNDCAVSYHKRCLDPPLSKLDRSTTRNPWRCPPCNVYFNLKVTAGREEPFEYERFDDDGTNSSSSSSLTTSGGESRKRKASDRRKELPRKRARVRQTDEECHVCKGGGSLVLCDYPRCPRVYHLPCLQMSVPWPEEQQWLCPQHFCVTCGVGEDRDGGITLSACSKCPNAVCQGCTRSSSRSSEVKAFRCLHCDSPAPPVALAMLLERLWAKVGSHYLAAPFLQDVSAHEAEAYAKIVPAGGELTCLGDILFKIRRLGYTKHEQMVTDVEAVLQWRVALCGAKYDNIKEGAQTIARFLQTYRNALAVAIKDAELAVEKEKKKDEKDEKEDADEKEGEEMEKEEEEVYSFRAGIEKRALPWGRSWRRMQEWDVYISNAPVQHVSIPSEPPHKRGGNFGFGVSQVDIIKEMEAMDGEMVDVVDAASALLHLPEKQSNEVVPGYSNPLDKGPDYINLLFSRQSRLLREAVEINGKLRAAWQESRTEMMQDAFGGVVTIGEGRVAAELKRSNRCLTSRIERLELELSKEKKEAAKAALEAMRLRKKATEAKAK